MKNIFDSRLAAMIIILLTILASCSTLNKHKSSEAVHQVQHVQANSDSSRIVSSDSVTLSDLESSHKISMDTTATTTTTDDNSETITVNLLNEAKDSLANHPANEYAGAPSVHDIIIDGHDIHSTQSISNIVLQNRKGRTVIQAKNAKAVDSSGTKNIVSTDSHTLDSGHFINSSTSSAVTDISIKKKDVKRSGTSFGLYIWIAAMIMIIAIGIYFGWWKWLWAFFRKKQADDKNANTLTSVPYQPPPPPDKI